MDEYNCASKKKDPKFTVVPMMKDDFLSCKDIEKIITNRKKTNNNEKVDWLKIQKIINIRSNPFNLIIERYSTNKFVQQIQVSLRKHGKNSESMIFSNVNFTPLYTKSRPITRKKYDDLQKLIEFIPSQFHSFFKTLEYDDSQPNSKRVKKN